MSDYSDTTIRVAGAREHNLRDVTLTLPKGRLICFTGVSGSGKSSLAFDTLYAEGQRRYVESLSSYARQFLGELPKPDCDQISGLSPAISIQQKTSGWNPRSTVGTITQVHDYLRVLFARAGTAFCPACAAPITAQTREQMIARVLALPEGTRFLLLAPKVRGQKGEHRDLFEELISQGFARARVDGSVVELREPPPLDRNRRHDVEVVVDRLVVAPEVRARLAESLDLALTTGDGAAIVVPLDGVEDAGGSRECDLLLSAAYACGACGRSFEAPHPNLFSFNSPQGMCTDCDGLGTRVDFDPALLVPDTSKSFYAPCIVPMRRPPGRWARHLYEGVAEYLGVDLSRPWRELPAAARRALLYGTGSAHITYEWQSREGTMRHGGTFAGVIADLQARYRKSAAAMIRRYYEQFMRQAPCSTCGGSRLRPAALAVRLRSRAAVDPARAAKAEAASAPDPAATSGDRRKRGRHTTKSNARGAAPAAGASGCELNLAQVCALPIDRALAFCEQLELDGVRRQIAAEPIKEICARLRFLVDVGLDYLTLERAAPTLSGGESQRIRLASQIGSGLVGVLYVLDEPSIGLHARDNQRLLASLRRLRDLGNTVIVVEHDEETMRAADHIVDFGPGPGVRGGAVVAQGSLEELARAGDSLTGAYLSGARKIEIPTRRRPVRVSGQTAGAAAAVGAEKKSEAGAGRRSAGRQGAAGPVRSRNR